MDIERREKSEKPEFGEHSKLANSVVEKAQLALDEHIDQVKQMNQLIAFAKVQTIRDSQIAEKQLSRKRREEEELHADKLMADDRERAVAAYEARERKRAEDKRKGALVVVSQIAEREKARMIEAEQLAKERAFVLKQIEQQRIDEEQIRIEKKMAQAHMLDEVLEINSRAAKEKEDRALVDKLEDLQLLEYRRQKDLREKQLEDQQLKEAEEREAQLSKLRAKQERATDRTVELDALRAKRAIEAAERAARAREQKEKERLEGISVMMAEARQVQQAEKQLRLIEQIRDDKAEFDRLVALQLDQQRIGQEKEERLQRQLRAHVVAVQDQIRKKQEVKNGEREKNFQEGKELRTMERAERSKLAAIKARKIESIRQAGIPGKHCLKLLQFQPC